MHPYTDEACDTVCATCAAAITHGVPLTQIETPTTANHADYFRFGSKHVCPACAWLFDAGKGRPGNYIATPGRMEYAVISLESVVTDKRPWLRIYDQAADPRRARSEFAFAAGGGDAIRRHGAWEAWRQAYPELWGRWQARWLGPNAGGKRSDD